MPELPEVETIRRGIEPYLMGNVILYTMVYNKYLRWQISDEICALNHEYIFSVKRRAKYLLLELTDGWIVIHLGMSGSLHILTEKSPPKKHDHIDLIINGGKVLRYTDPRRFGSWLWTKDLKEHRVLNNLGPEPINDEFNADYLKSKCVKRRVAIKPYLMNRQLVAGIGNIYSNESLFAARIHPDRMASSLSYEECEILVKSIKMILQRSIEQGGATIKDFLQSNGKPGYFFKELQVYGRKDRPCLVCNAPIATSKHVERVTFYCNNCQR